MNGVQEIGRILDAQFSWLLLPSAGANYNLFLGDLPDTTPDLSVAIYQYGGQSPERTLEGIWAERPRIQIVVRHPKFEVAERHAYVIWEYMNELNGFPGDDSLYFSVMSLDSPFEIGPDAKGRQRIVSNYSIRKEVGTNAV